MENNPMSSLPISQRLKLSLDSTRAEIAKTAEEPFTWEEFLSQMYAVYLHYVCDSSIEEIKKEMPDTETWEMIKGVIPGASDDLIGQLKESAEDIEEGRIKKANKK